MESGNKKDLRHQKILALLNERETIELTELCSLLGSSESTIRNDLRYLEGTGNLIRTFGGAMKAGITSVTLRSSDNQKEKRWIADYAFRHLVLPGNTITVDSGSTGIELAVKISESNMPLNVITASFYAASVLVNHSSVELNLVGGKYDANFGSFYDENSTTVIKTMRSDIFFLGAKGVSPSAGYSITSAAEASVKRTMIECAQRTVALMDHSKIGTVAFKLVCGIEDVDMIVTDDKADPQMVEELRARGITVVLVSAEGDTGR